MMKVESLKSVCPSQEDTLRVKLPLRGRESQGKWIGSIANFVVRSARERLQEPEGRGEHMLACNPEGERQR